MVNNGGATSPQHTHGVLKVLQINNVYKTGSTGKITCDLHRKLTERGVTSLVCYGRGKKVRDAHTYKVCSNAYAKLNKARSMLDGIMYGGCRVSTAKLIRVIQREKPDIVHLQCINGYFVNIYRLISFLKENHIKTLLTLHAEFMYTGGCGHSLTCTQWKTPGGCGNQACPRFRAETKSLLFDRTGEMWKRMKAAFDGFDQDLLVASVSPWLMNRAKQSLILGDKKHTVVLNGVNTDVFHPYNAFAEKDTLGLKDKKIVLHVTVSFSAAQQHIKGGCYVLELAKKMKDEDVVFLVVGPYDVGLNLPSNVKLLGKIEDQQLLAKYYSMADVTLLTSERETFSLVTAESLCCGTPVVGFKTGAPEQIAIPEYSLFVEHGDMDGLMAGVRAYLGREKDSALPKIAAEKYSTDAMADGYMNCYTALLGE